MVDTAEIRRFVVDTFLFGDGSWLGDETSFLEEGVIDSAGMLELITFLEANYGITVADEEVVRENLDSLRSAARYLQVKLGCSPEFSASGTGPLPGKA
jgi:acyl carrier protein